MDRPILWYGFFFAFGFFLGYWAFTLILKKFLSSDRFEKKQLSSLAEKLGFYVVCGMIIGARLGDLLFYQDWSDLMHHPLTIFKFWEGGLASHGAIAGILYGTYLFLRKIKKDFPLFNWQSLLDLMVIPGCIAAIFIRIGNFMNQEILGTLTTVPWAVIFGHPADGSIPLPRHPVQLYEALFYFLLSSLLWILREKVPAMKKTGKTSGLFFISLFTFRFFIEFFKSKQSALLSADAVLDMGQLLSIPFILFGIFLLFEKQFFRFQPVKRD